MPVRILFLEDNAIDFELVSEFLLVEGIDCRIMRASDRQSFERLFEPVEFDLVLSDYGVPGYSGFAALQFVRAKDDVIPFILLSGTLSEEQAVDSLHAGATDYIIKQRLHRLAPAIERALREAKAQRQNMQAAEALRASEERFNLATRATNEVIWEWDLASDEIWCSETFDVVFGYNHGSRTFGAQEKISRIHPSDQPRVAGQMQEKLRSKDSLWVEEYQFLRRDGRYAHVLDRAMIYRDEGGRPVRFIGAMSDVTYRREAEEQIREQAALLDKARDAIVLIGVDQVIQYWNQSAERIFGWSAAEAVGKHVSEFLLPRNLPNEKGLHDHLLAENEWRGEFEARTKSGKRIVVDSHWSLMRDAPNRDPKAILLINTDVTEKKEMEAQFLRAQRIETIGTLSGGIAHDLNNALAPIVMASELLAEEIKSDSGQRILEMVRTSANRCGEMVKQILSFSRGAGQGWELLDPCKVVDELAGLCRETFTRLITIKVRCEPRVNLFLGNLTQIHQVIMNLLVNARDAMPRGGEIRINVKNVLLHQRLNKMLSKAADGDFISIAVTDSGSGIAPEIMDRIFEPFFTTKEVGKGTGLGLSTVFSIVKGHEGFIELRSEVGKGTTFEVYLPAQAREKGALIQETPSTLPDAHGEQLLIVDDEAGLLAMIKSTLETLGYSVLTAADGLAALAALEARPAEIDLVIADWQMPLMSGAELVRKIQSGYPNLRIIVATGDTARVDEISAFSVQGILAKPYTTAEMLKLIRDALGKATRVAPQNKR